MFLRRVGLGLSSFFCLAVGLNGCQTKVSQCNELITIVNRVSDDLGQLQTDAKTNASMQNTDQMAAQLEKFASSLEKNTQEMASIGVEAPLKPFQQSLVTTYKTALNNSRTLAVAVKAQNQPAAQTALNALNAAGGGEAKALKAIGDYCKIPQ
jgi:hypothetical protein